MEQKETSDPVGSSLHFPRWAQEPEALALAAPTVSSQPTSLLLPLGAFSPHPDALDLWGRGFQSSGIDPWCAFLLRVLGKAWLP